MTKSASIIKRSQWHVDKSVLVKQMLYLTILEKYSWGRPNVNSTIADDAFILNSALSGTLIATWWISVSIDGKQGSPIYIKMTKQLIGVYFRVFRKLGKFCKTTVWCLLCKNFTVRWMMCWIFKNTYMCHQVLDKMQSVFPYHAMAFRWNVWRSMNANHKNAWQNTSEQKWTLRSFNITMQRLTYLDVICK